MDSIVKRKIFEQDAEVLGEKSDALGLDVGVTEEATKGLAEDVVARKTTKRKRKKEVALYSVEDLVQSGGFALGRGLVSVALRSGGKEKYSMQEAESLISAMKERKV